MLWANSKIFRWPLNHKVKAIAVLLFFMLLLRLVWGWSVHRDVRSQLQTIRARGEPVDATEVRHQTVPDEQNAVVLYRKAIKLKPKDASAHAGLGWALFVNGQREQGLQEEQKAVSLNPSVAAD